MEVRKYMVTIEALDDEGLLSSLELAVSVASGRPVVTGFHINAAEGVDAREPWNRFNVDAQVDLLPKTGTVYEHQEGEATTALVHRATVAELGPAAVPEQREPEREPEPDPPLPVIEVPVEPKASRPIIEVRRPGTLDRALSAREVTTIANDLRARIAKGEYPVGSRIPLRRDIRQMYPGCTDHSIKMAVTRLQREGLLGEGTAAGTFVLRHTPKGAQKAAEPSGQPTPARGSRTRQERLRGDLAEMEVVERPKDS